MSPKPKDAVWISREAAKTALTELNYILDYADDERETGGERAARDDLYHAINDDEPRTAVTSNGEFDTITIAGVSDGAIVIDHGRTPPRAVVTADDGEMPTDIIELPTDETDDTAEGKSSPETVIVGDSSNRGDD
jgi:hypothetical protein